jgi:hypothetical protein
VPSRLRIAAPIYRVQELFPLPRHARPRVSRFFLSALANIAVAGFLAHLAMAANGAELFVSNINRGEGDAMSRSSKRDRANVRGHLCKPALQERGGLGLKARGRGLFAMLLVLPIATAHAITITLPLGPTSDRSAWDTNNDGVVDMLRPESDPVELNELHVAKEAAPSWVPGTGRAAMEFVIGPAFLRPLIASATLFLRNTASYNLATEANKFQIRVHSYDGDGIVSLDDMFVDNPFIGPSFLESFSIPPTPQFLYDLAFDVRPAILALNPSEFFLGLMLEAVTPNGGFSFASKEHAFAPGPLLRIDLAIPEPSTLALLAVVGLVGLGLAWSRRAL